MSHFAFSALMLVITAQAVPSEQAVDLTGIEPGWSSPFRNEPWYQRIVKRLQATPSEDETEPRARPGGATTDQLQLASTIS